MVVKTYGSIEYDDSENRFEITKAEPHICMRLKQVFLKIPTHGRPPYYFRDHPDVCADLLWFMSRFPLSMNASTRARLEEGAKKHTQNVNEIEAIHHPDYVPPVVVLKDNFKARDYQVRGQQMVTKVKRLLIADDLGLGKTLTSIMTLLEPGTLPAVVVIQTHMPKQWQVDGIEKFTNLTTHIIKGTRPYNLPKADVYILKYSCLIGWIDTFSSGYYKTVIFDECQEFRRSESGKYKAGAELAASAQYVIGLSATPIFNYGDEIFNVLEVINPGQLGSLYEFRNEWCHSRGDKWQVTDPQALGSYLRERFMMLRRTRKDVGRELPPVNKIVHTVDYDVEEVKKHESLAQALAMKVMTGSFAERGTAARELDLLARQTTGISKARYVCEYVKMLLENDLAVVLTAWHRAVYEIYLTELSGHLPVMYTGSESGAQKEKAKQAFINKETNLFIISLRSGAGVDGLQNVCSDIVFGEFDWSPKVHDQLIGRLHRDLTDENQTHYVNAHFLMSDSGSDPVIVNMLGLKASQSRGLMDPLSLPTEQFSDDSRIKVLAQHYLNKQKQ